MLLNFDDLPRAGEFNLGTKSVFCLLFFTPKLWTDTSSPLGGMARNYFLLSTWIHKRMQFVVSRSILFLPPYTREKKISRLSLSLKQMAMILIFFYFTLGHWNYCGCFHPRRIFGGGRTGFEPRSSCLAKQKASRPISKLEFQLLQLTWHRLM